MVRGSLTVAMLVLVTSFLLASQLALADTHQNTLRLSPAAKLVNPGLDFNVSVTIDANSTVYLAQFFIDYDPSVLSVNSVSHGNLFVKTGYLTYPVNYIDNVNGRVGFSNMRVPSTSGDRGNKTVAVISFHSRNSTGASALAFVPGMSKLLNASGGLLSVHTEGGNVAIRSNPGNVNNDCMVDGEDMFIVGSAFNSRPGLAAWNPNADLNEDGVIDIVDLSTVGINFGKILSSPEICDVLDNDCDGMVDEGGACEVCGDGLCDPNEDPESCPEDCGGNMDMDGDGWLDSQDNCPSNFNPDQMDTDNDGIGDMCDSDADNDGWPSQGDCDDHNQIIYPGAPEISCDGVDQDCDGADYCPGTDSDGDGFQDDSDNCPSIVNPGQEDMDGDGLGDACDSCPTGRGNDADDDGYCTSTDCDDSDVETNPAAMEKCDGKDNDCDGLVDNGVVCGTTCYGIPATNPGVCSSHGICISHDMCACATGWIGVSCSIYACHDYDSDGFNDNSCGGDDCNDAVSGIHPGAPEISCDGIDQDCDGMDQCPECGDDVCEGGENCGSCPADCGVC